MFVALLSCETLISVESQFSWPQKNCAVFSFLTKHFVVDPRGLKHFSSVRIMRFLKVFPSVYRKTKIQNHQIWRHMIYTGEVRYEKVLSEK